MLYAHYLCPMPNPLSPPEIKAITELHLPAYETSMLPNGMPIYTLRGGSEPVLKMEIVFRAGASYETKPVVAEVMAGLMSEGTMHRSSIELAETVESVGATLFTRGGVDTARVRLLTLSRFFPDLIHVVREVIEQPAFDPNELSTYTDNKIERIKIDLKKNEVIAYRHLTEIIFGPAHPYGKNVFPEHYQAIGTHDLRAHHDRHIIPQKAFMILSGATTDRDMELIHQTIGSWNPHHANGTDIKSPIISETRNGYHEYDGPQKHQSAIRIGRKLFPQSHQDFDGLFVLNTILGGYFGSRLMMEIRENQGLTYGIYSSVDSFATDGCFYISTETATDNTDKVIKAIRHETDRLRQDLIPDEELLMARNYLMGHLMTQIDGAFATMDFVKSMKIEYLEDVAFARMVRTIQDITPAQLRDLAIRYLDMDEWATIIVK